MPERVGFIAPQKLISRRGKFEWSPMNLRQPALSIALAVITTALAGEAADVHAALPLWTQAAPESNPAASPQSTLRITPEGEHVITHVEVPSITPYLPAPGTATGAAVIVAPGGGHSEIWIDHEGYNVAAWLSSHGVAAFVLQYRLARAKDSAYTIEGTELGDMQRAIRVVRSRSREWKIDPAHVGVMGFSAGGELAALASTRYDTGQPAATDPIERISSKPAFQALLYPAIPDDPRLTADTPKAFLACGALDRINIAQGLPELYLALAKLQVPAELHVFAGVGHGFGIRSRGPKSAAAWPQLFLDWMSAQQLLHTD
ncbi:alpha/beta hydrolase [Granulicella sp. dw_53]|uniref:alpha/beta hydrolase n=1 Tax=Granulicella sp. dw_53 TaxID=2719792 RepID=UPI002105723C|nr:alpha/beta hydrolase [Granulicella sp. dw_53]